MIDMEGLWRGAKEETPVCAATGTTKKMILRAITDGARSYEELAAAVPLCGGACAARSVSARGCRENAETLLKIYAPVYGMMTEGGGCARHKERPARGKEADGSGRSR